MMILRPWQRGSAPQSFLYYYYFICPVSCGIWHRDCSVISMVSGKEAVARLYYRESPNVFRDGSTIMHSDARLSLTSTSHQMTLALLSQFPVTAKERQDLLPPTDRERNPYILTESKTDGQALVGGLKWPHHLSHLKSLYRCIVNDFFTPTLTQVCR